MKKTALTVVFWLAALAAGAQTPTGTISGTVSDATGSAVSDARVPIVNLDTGWRRTVHATDAGEFVAPGLPPGLYRLTSAVTGFAEIARDARVEAGLTTTVNLQLELEGVSTAVLVEAALPLIHPASHQVTAVVSRTQIEALPLNGRNYLELARLEPGITHPIRGTNGRTFISVLGAGLQTNPRIGATRVTIDGASVGGVGAIGAALKISPEAVQEFQVSTVNFDVSTGSTSSGAINIVTRSGGNVPHGGAFAFYRDRALSAYPALGREPTNPNPFFRRRQPGGWFGGPLRPNRIFLFTNYELLDQQSVVSVQPNTPELNALGGIFPSETRGHQLSTRVDAIGGVHQVFARYTHDRDDGFAPLNDRTDILPSGWSRMTNRTDQTVAAWTAILSPVALSDLRVSYFFQDSSELPPGRGECGDCFGIDGPRINIPDAEISWGTPRTLVFTGRRYQLTETLTWQKGRHLLRFALDWEHGLTRTVFEAQERGQIDLYSPRQTRETSASASLPPSFVTPPDFLALPVQRYSFAVGDGTLLQRGFRQTRVLDAYRVTASDMWRIGSRLTVNGGVAWSYEPNVLNDDLPRPALLTALVGSDGPSPSTLTVSPALGFAWTASPDGATVVHGGIGRYADPLASANSLGLGLERQALMPAGVGRLTVGPVNFPRPTALTAAQLVAALPAMRAELARNLNPHNRDLTIRNLDVTKTARNLTEPLFVAPHAIHLNAGVQHQFSRTLAASLNVVVRRFTHTFITDIDYNRWNSAAGPVIPRCSPDQGNDSAARCSNGPITFDAAAGHARSLALVARLDKRFSGRLQLLASYALSRFTGTNGTGPGTGFTSLNPVANTGALPTDRRHVLNVSGLVELPWRLSAGFNVSAYSAPPFSAFVAGVDFDGDGTRNDLLPGSRVNAFGRSATRADLARLVALYNRDGAGRPLCCGQAAAPPLALPLHFDFDDTFFTQDLRVTRTFRVRSATLAVMIEAFNLFNTANLTQFSGNLANPDVFGQPGARGTQVFGSGGPRALQLGVRAAF